MLSANRLRSLVRPCSSGRAPQEFARHFRAGCVVRAQKRGRHHGKQAAEHQQPQTAAAAAKGLIYTNEETKIWRALGFGANAQFWSSLAFGGYMGVGPPAEAMPLLERGMLAGVLISVSSVILFGVSKLSGRLITRIEREGGDRVRFTCVGSLKPREYLVRAADIKHSPTGAGESPFQPIKVQVSDTQTEILFVDSLKGTVHDERSLLQMLR